MLAMRLRMIRPGIGAALKGLAMFRPLARAFRKVWGHGLGGRSRPRMSIIALGAGAADDCVALYRSLEAQTYGEWGLDLCMDSSIDQPDLVRMAGSRLRTLRLQPDCPQETVRQALAGGDSAYVVLLRPTDRLVEDALETLATAIGQFPAAALFYADVACLAVDERRTPILKPAWNSELFRSMDYVSGFLAVRRDMLLGYSLPEAAWAQEWLTGLLLDLARRGGEFRHIPRVLLERRDCAGNPAGNACDVPARIGLIKASLGGESGISIVPGALVGTLRLRYPVPEPSPRVDIIIPTRNGGARLQKCVESVLKRTRYDRFSITLVDNQSDDPATLDYLMAMASRPDVRMLTFARPFNFSAINNLAVGSSNAEVVCLLNDDMEVLSEDWLRELVSHAVRPEVGAVGAKLLYPDGAIQHAGIIVGMRRSAAHGHKGFPGDAPGYMGRLQVAQNCTAVTGACLAVRRELYARLGGLNEEDLAVAYNDVDFCLRLGAAGYQNVWTPHALLYHHESASRGREDTPAKRRRLKAEARYMNKRWRMDRFDDPCYHPGLTLTREDFSPAAWAARAGRRWRGVAR